MPVALAAGQLERHAPKPRLGAGVGVDRIDAPNVALAVKDIEVIDLPMAGDAGPYAKFLL